MSAILPIAAIVLVSEIRAQSRVDAAFAQFWAAATPAEAAAAAAAVVATGVEFDAAIARLKRGRVYSPQVPRGVVKLTRTSPSAAFPYTLDVPASYDPSRRYQVRVHLHGGVTRPEPGSRGDGGIGTLAGAEQIYVIPTAWRDAPWWSAAQQENVRAILDRVKRTYNVNENRVVLSGVSDGATGAYYLAMRDTTPFAAFLPLNGFLMVLAQESTGVREPLFVNNLLNKPFFVVNGSQDRLYPTSLVEPYVRHLARGGVTVAYHPQPGGEHNTAWWPEVKGPFEAFVREHGRQPHPARLTWQAAAGGARAHWLVIDDLAPRGAEAPLPDLNDFPRGEMPNFGVRTAGMRITSVLAGSNADAFGLMPGDVVESVNGRVLPAAVNLLDLLSIFTTGERLTLVVARNGARTELTGAYAPAAMPNVVALFPSDGRSGRVDAVREGNVVRTTTRGVAGFTVLVSPDAFDLGKPLTVIADGRTVFDGPVQPGVATLMKWAAQDNDRTMLYAAEVRVRLAP